MGIIKRNNEEYGETMNWKHKIKVTHLFTEKKDLKSVQKSMNLISEVIEKESFFQNFKDLKKFKKIPKGDEYFGPVDYANNLIEKMYNYADENSIWID